MPVPCPPYPPSMVVSLRSLSSSRGFDGCEKRRDTGGRKWRKGLETGGSKGGPRIPRVGGIGGADVEVQLISRGVKREGKREREGVIRWRARGMSQGLRWQIRRIYPYLLGALNSRDASTGAVSGCFLLNRLTFRCMRLLRRSIKWLHIISWMRLVRGFNLNPPIGEEWWFQSRKRSMEIDQSSIYGNCCYTQLQRGSKKIWIWFHSIYETLITKFHYKRFPRMIVSNRFLFLFFFVLSAYRERAISRRRNNWNRILFGVNEIRRVIIFDKS